MNRESLNRGEANAFNFMIIPIVMAIVFFLAVHPYNSASSPSFYFSQVITCLLVPELGSSLFPWPFGNLTARAKCRRHRSCEVLRHFVSKPLDRKRSFR